MPGQRSQEQVLNNIRIVRGHALGIQGGFVRFKNQFHLPPEESKQTRVASYRELVEGEYRLIPIGLLAVEEALQSEVTGAASKKEGVDEYLGIRENIKLQKL